jgi:crotonobetainyl-CoA:carnitine CoA-transferase CaiB-like acyl-CoA transferase
MPQAFSGIRVIDFTQVYAGPFAAQQLAQFGADVIKVEQPGIGDMTRRLGAGNDTGGDANAGMAPAFLTCNLGKRAITLNLKHPEATPIVHALVRTADVVMENFTAGVMSRLGFGYEQLRALRPDLVYCSISGFGQAGPLAGVAAFDGAVQAASGMMAVTGHPETGPTRTGYMPVDMATALNAAFAISAALLRRARTGEGQYLDVAMMDTAMVLQAAQVTAYLVQDEIPALLGNRSPTLAPTANVFPTAEGYLQLVALNDRQVAALFEVLGITHALADPRFATAQARIAHTPEVTALLTGALASAPSSTWLQRCRDAGVPCAEIRDYAAVTADPQFDTRAIFAPISAPAVAPPGGSPRESRVVAAGHVANTDGPQVQRPPPRLGEHTDEVLHEIGYDDARIAALREGGAI